MSKEIKNITENVMNQIHNGKVKMKPKIYFVLGSVLAFVGLVSSVVFSVFLFGLIRFSLRVHGRMGQYRFDELISNFPWWTLVFAVVGLILGIWIFRRYDFSYKKEPWIVILGFILIIIVSGWVIDVVGLNDGLLQRGPMKRIMQNYYPNKDIQGGLWWRN